MKIFYTITKSEAGGAQTHVFQLAKHFSSLGNEVVIMSSPDGWLQKKASELGVKFISNPFFSNSVNPFNCFRAMSFVKKEILKEKPDIVHAHSSGAGFYTRVALKNKIPTIYTAHGWGFNIGISFWQKYLAILGEKIGSDFCEKIICVSEFVKNLGIRYHVANIDKFITVYNGVEDIYSSNVIERNNEKIKIIFVGRLASPKLPNLLLETVASLPDDLNQKIEVCIIGGGDSKEALQSYAREMKLENVKLCGDLVRKDIFPVLLKSDIFILLSRWEGLPLTILEAMSAGLPIIASKVGGIPEAVSPENGILVENKTEDIKLALAKLINDVNKRKVLGENSRKIFLQKFLLSDMLKKTEVVYNELLK